MKSTVLWSLIVVNAVLLTALLGRLMKDNTAMAQQAPVARREEFHPSEREASQ